MKKMKKILILILSLCTLLLTAQEKDITWYTDIQQAINISIKQEKPLLLFFTGKDWCGPCKMTAKYVFGSQEFAKWSDNVVLVELDFPRGAKRSKIPAEHIQLAQQLQVRSYPTVWFVNTTVVNKEVQLQNISPPIIGGSRDAKSWISQAQKILTTVKK